MISAIILGLVCFGIVGFSIMAVFTKKLSPHSAEQSDRGLEVDGKFYSIDQHRISAYCHSVRRCQGREVSRQDAAREFIKMYKVKPIHQS